MAVQIRQIDLTPSQPSVGHDHLHMTSAFQFVARTRRSLHLDRLLAERGQNPQALLFSGVGTRPSPCGTFIRYGAAWGEVYNRHSKTVWPRMKAHAWRAFAISEMARGGIPEEVRRRVVGHAIMGVHDGYTHVDAARLKAAVETIP